MTVTTSRIDTRGFSDIKTFTVFVKVNLWHSCLRTWTFLLVFDWWNLCAFFPLLSHQLLFIHSWPESGWEQSKWHLSHWIKKHFTSCWQFGIYFASGASSLAANQHCIQVGQSILEDKQITYILLLIIIICYLISTEHCL